MKRMSLLALTAGAAFGAQIGIAAAADLLVPPPPPPPPPPHFAPPKVHAGGAFYLRGHIGMSNQEVDGLDNALFATADVEFIGEPKFDSAPIFGLGFGYELNDWLRLDAYGEYRGRSTFSALDRYDTLPADGVYDGTNEYGAVKSEWLLMANAYVDLGTWNGITPYAGAGIGAARIGIHGFEDVNTPLNAVAYAGDNAVWNFAWALHAGAEFEINDRVSLDLGYTYLNMGDAESGDIIAFDGTNTVNNPMIFDDITSHDVKLGMRYKFGGHKAVLAPPPPPPGVYKH